MGFQQKHVAAPIAVAALAAVLLFWNLGAVYLWQDEAATAVLAVRMLEHGRPLAWDGRNLITMDHVTAEDPAEAEVRSRDPQAAIRAYAARGDFRSDTTWTGQPWGQFVAAAASIAAFGRTTVAARLSFTVAALLTVFLLTRWASLWLGSAFAGAAAGVLLALNAFWILHARQSRYYALSCLFVLLAVAAWRRWTDGAAHGPLSFVLASFGLFQCDYGTFWPVTGVLLVSAAIARGWRPALAAGAVLAAAVVPFVFFYQLFDRAQPAAMEFGERFLRLAFNVNQFIASALVLGASFVLARRADRTTRRLVFTCIALIGAVLLWSAAVAPFSFHRYVVSLTAIGALLGSFVATALAKQRLAVAAAVVAALVLTPLASIPAAVFVPAGHRTMPRPFALVRPELALAARAIFDPPRDPNSRVIEWLEPRLRPGDEVLVSYEDIPIMYYTGARVRGGISGFRVLDDKGTPPRFAILRKVTFVPWPLFQRALDGSRWSRRDRDIDAPDVPWGNNPDPMFQNWAGTEPPRMTVIERSPIERLAVSAPSRPARARRQ